MVSHVPFVPWKLYLRLVKARSYPTYAPCGFKYCYHLEKNLLGTNTPAYFVLPSVTKKKFIKKFTWSTVSLTSEASSASKAFKTSFFAALET